VADFFLLGFLGGHPAEEPYITASRLASVFYFGFFIVILPLTSLLEQIITTDILTTDLTPGPAAGETAKHSSAAVHRRQNNEFRNAVEADYL
jgi:ubiquinol-cytochrome c reductase cytochrome b subunit